MLYYVRPACPPLAVVPPRFLLCVRCTRAVLPSRLWFRPLVRLHQKYWRAPSPMVCPAVRLLGAPRGTAVRDSLESAAAAAVAS